MAIESVAAWLLTLALHGCVLLCLAWIVDRGVLRAYPGWRELLWRVALFGGALTASVQALVDAPLPARIVLARAAAPVVPAPAKPTSVAAHSAPGNARIGTPAARTEAQVPAARTPTPALASSLPGWQSFLVAGWLAGALLALVRLTQGWLRLRGRLAHASALDRADVATDAAALAIQARIRAPLLSVIDDLASPIAVGGRRIVLPRWALELLAREQLRAMIAHETAHLARRDPEWKLAIAAWSALLWFLPLTAIARRRLDEIAELSCDAWAARSIGDGRALAECLAECAGRRVGGFEAGLVSAMAGRDSPLLQRIDQLIEGSLMNIRISRAHALVASALVLTAAAFVLPGVGVQPAHAQADPVALPAPPPAPPRPPAAPQDARGQHVHIASETGPSGTHEFTTVDVSLDGHAYGAKIDGEIAFDDNDHIARLGDGGTASFTETRAGVTRRVDYSSTGGKLAQRYFVDNREQPIDAAAQAWIAQVIPMVIRATAINAPARVRRILAQGGPSAVLDEIARIDSDYARGVYLRELCATAKLDRAQTTRAIALIDGFSSDYERRNALAAIGANAPLDAAQQKLVIAQAAKIDSDYERAELLVGLLPELVVDADVRAAWLKAAEGIGSDFEHRRTLSALVAAGHNDDASLAKVIGAAQSIDSDYERRSLLVTTIGAMSDADRAAQVYVRAVAGIGSAYERREALFALIGAHGFGATGTRAVLDAAAAMDSDYECREVLVALARVMPGEADLIARFREVARQLSGTERGAAERALDRFAS